jgi:hypothetical protein
MEMDNVRSDDGGCTDIGRRKPFDPRPVEIFYRESNESNEFSELKESSYELVEQTEISNFENIWFKEISTREVADYLHKYIPPSHLNNCHSIKYDSKQHPDSVFILGETVSYPNGQDITIYSPTVWLKLPELAKKEILDTLTHEVGHNVHINLFKQYPNLCQEWQNLYQQEGKGFVSQYATTRWEEDFAESYKTYVRDPEWLNIVNPEKYDFLKENVFSGREFVAVASEDPTRFYQVAAENYVEACKQGAMVGILTGGVPGAVTGCAGGIIGQGMSDTLASSEAH